MKRSHSQQITIGLGLALALLVANTVVSYRNTLKLISNQRLVTHTQQVLIELEATLSTLKDAETGQRGYLITGEKRYLQPYESAVDKINRQINSLKQLTADNPNQQQRVFALENAIALKLTELAQTVKLRREKGFDAAQQVVQSDRGKQIMDNIRADIADMENIETQLLQQRTQESQAKLQETLLTFSIAAAINLALLALVYYLFRLNHRQSKQEEERLRQNNEQLTLALDAGKMGSWDWNLQTNEVLWTIYHEIIFGYEPGKPNRSYKEWADRVHPEDLPKVEALVQASVKNQQDFHAEYRVVCSDNSLHWVTAFGRFQRDAENRPIRMVGVLSDITERKQTEAKIIQLNETLEQRVLERTTQLEEANEELQAFAYSVSHDLRAPLRAMQGFAEALLEDYEDILDELGKEYATRIVTSAQRLENLIQDLLAYSRLSRSDLQLKVIDLTTIMSEAMTQLEAEIEQTQAQVNIQSPLPKAIAHRATLVQVITNLLTNAMKFVDDGVSPQIKVWAEIHGECVRLWVEDNGIGIAREHQKRIFRVFERLHGMETYPGTGIGLAIVRKGIDRMGGCVGVESQLGQGSRFWIELRRGE
ncbi:PAS domain-containing protein [Hassallia byssoidea VB512170]|uniref:histidine kinase n=1 Tax=Hassallia byssoidea VB512170 TaxID=1304833 RepID=A0A846HEG2_9CYAN|nr:sensor histidine kinase [Hassalia byssoidea]NEU75762.1 PAS domain-containing protein [Hassalia byssoidea VB512170]